MIFHKDAYVRIQSLTNQALIADKCLVANRFLTRLRGLIGRTRFVAGEALLFPRNRSIHMWWMFIPIDVVFLARSGTRLRVSSVHARVRPWKALPLSDRKATETLELPVGSIERCAIQVGDELECIN